MRAMIAGGGRGQWRVDCAVVLEAAEAKRLANDAMARRWAERDRMTLRLAPSHAGLKPSDLVVVEGVAGLWLVDEVTLDGLVVIASLRRSSSGGHAIAADAGRGTGEIDLPIGTTDLALFDLPDMGLGESGLSVWLAASADGGFKPVPVSLTVNQQPLANSSVARRAILGRALTALGAGSANTIDMVNMVETQLTSSEQLLLNADDDALATGANLMLLGNELIQFGRADQIGPGRFILSRLLRGRRGTEWAIGGHQPGERIVAIDRAALVRINLDAGMRGGLVEALAYGVADDVLTPPAALIEAGGEALRPPSPCQLATSISDDGLTVSWLPRCRDGWAWVDGAGDCPTADRRFELLLEGPGGTWRGEVQGTSAIVDPSSFAALGAGPIRIAVSELTATSISRPAKAAI